MRQARSPAVLVMAILNTIFGGLGILLGICLGLNVMMLPLLSSATKGVPNNLDKISGIPGYLPFAIGTAVFYLVFATLLLVSGIGMFTVKSWARYLAIFVALMLLLEQIGVVSFQLLYLNPLMLEANKAQLQQIPGMNAFNTPGLMAAGALLIKGAIPVAYAIALLVVMFLPGVRAGFRPPMRSTIDDAAYDDNTVVDDEGFRHREERRP